MSYQLGKTLEENIKSNSILNEDSEIDEAGGEFGLANDLKAAGNQAEKVAHLAQFFKMSEQEIKMAMVEQEANLRKAIESAAAADVKAGFRAGESGTLGAATKKASKALAVHEILASTKELSEQDIINIIEKTKKDAGTLAMGKNASAVAKDIKTASQAKDATKLGKELKITQEELAKAKAELAARGSSTIQTFNAGADASAAMGKETAAIADAETKAIAETATETIKEMKPTRWEKFKLWAKEHPKSMKVLGYLGAGIGLGAAGWVAWKLMSPGASSEDVKQSLFDNCVGNLLDDEGATLTSEDNLMVVTATKTGVEEYDKAGGVKFYQNGVMKTVDGKRTGKWSCPVGATAPIAKPEATNESTQPQKIKLVDLIMEQSGEVTQEQMTDFVDTAVDDLDGYVGVDNLQSLTNIVKQLQGKTYKGQPALTAFMAYYKEDESGDDFVKDIESVGVSTLGVQGIDAKNDLLKLVGGNASTATGGDGNTKTGVAGITMVWDDENKKTDDGGGGGGETPPKPQTFKNCDTLPFSFGCKNPIIKELQVCLGMDAKYQTGNFGPVTMNALGGYLEDQKITQKTVDAVKAKCNPTTGTTTGATATTTGTTTGATATTTGTTSSTTAATAPDETSATPEQPQQTTAAQGDNMTDTQFYNKLVQAGNIHKNLVGRMVYRGPALEPEEKSNLDRQMDDLGYEPARTTGTNKGARYAYKRKGSKQELGEPATDHQNVGQEPTTEV